MADFPSIDVACRNVPGGLVNGGDHVVALAIISTPSKVRLAPTSTNSTEINDIDSKGRNLNGIDPNTYETAAIPYAPADLRLFSRGVEACRIELQDPDARATLRDLSSRLSTLADDREAAIKKAKEEAAQKAAERKAKEAEKKAQEAQKKAEDAQKKADDAAKKAQEKKPVR